MPPPDLVSTSPTFISIPSFPLLPYRTFLPLLLATHLFPTTLLACLGFAVLFAFMGKILMQKFASVREGGSQDLPLARCSSVHETRPRYDRRRPILSDPANGPALKVGAQGSISTLVDQDVGAYGGLKDVVERPVELDVSWRDRLWLLGSRRKPNRWAEGLKHETKIDEEDESDGKIPKWKQLLRKFKKEAKKRTGSKGKSTQVYASQEQRFQYDSIKEKQEDKQRGPIVFPEPIPVKITEKQESTSPIWERRRVEQPSPLDLRKVKAPTTRNARVARVQ